MEVAPKCNGLKVLDSMP